MKMDNRSASGQLFCKIGCTQGESKHLGRTRSRADKNQGVLIKDIFYPFVIVIKLDLLIYENNC